MDYKKYILTILTFLFTNFSFASAEFEVVNVTETGYNSVSIEYSKPLNKTVDADYYLIKDLDIIEKTVKDYNNKNKLIVKLSEDLESDKNYILLSIVGAEGNISFSLPEDFRGLELMNEAVLSFEKQGIEYIKIIDAKNLEVYYTSEISKDVSIKMIKNIPSNSYSFQGDNSVEIQFEEDLVSFSEYTLAIGGDIESIEGDLLLMSDSLKSISIGDLSVFADNVQKTNNELETSPIVEEKLPAEAEKIIPENSTEKIVEEPVIEKNSPDEIIEPVVEEEPKEVIEVAHTPGTKLPNSGPKETALILLAMLLGILFTFKNQLIKQ